MLTCRRQRLHHDQVVRSLHHVGLPVHLVPPRAQLGLDLAEEGVAGLGLARHLGPVVALGLGRAPRTSCRHRHSCSGKCKLRWGYKNKNENLRIIIHQLRAVNRPPNVLHVLDTSISMRQQIERCVDSYSIISEGEKHKQNNAMSM